MIAEGLLALAILLAILTSSAVAPLSFQRDISMATGLAVTSLGATGRLLEALATLSVGHDPFLHLVGDTFSIRIVVGWVYFIAHYTEYDLLEIVPPSPSARSTTRTDSTSKTTDRGFPRTSARRCSSTGTRTATMGRGPVSTSSRPSSKAATGPFE